MMVGIVKALAVFLLIGMVSIGHTAPSNIKESEFLQGCRRPCQADSQKIGLPHFEGVRKCDCYCDRLWSSMTNSDVDHYVKTNTYSASTLVSQRKAFLACFGTK